MLKFLALTIILLISINYVKSASFLYLEGVPSAAHHIWNRALMKHLAEKGHNVTVLTVETEQSEKNLHFITMEGIYEAVEDEWLGKQGSLNFGHRNEFGAIKEMYDFHMFVSKKLVQTKGFEQLMNYPNDFQVNAIIHDFTGAHVLLGFCDKFNNPPLISVTPFGTPSFAYAVSGVDQVPSYIPHFTTNYGHDMNYLQRFKNTAIYVFDWIYRRFFYLKIENFVLKKHFGSKSNSIETLEQNSSLVLLNSDPALDYSVPLPPVAKAVGGLHTRRNEKITPVRKK